MVRRVVDLLLGYSPCFGLISSGGDKVVGIVVYHEHCLWKLSGAITEDWDLFRQPDKKNKKLSQTASKDGAFVPPL